jgi:phosphoribosylanthranilate isomerase
LPSHPVLRTRIKFCGLVRPDDVDTAVTLGVDAVGFVFYPRSPRAVTLDDARLLRRRLPSWVAAVGLFVDAQPAAVTSAVAHVGLDVVQFHGNESPATCRASRPENTPWWRAVRMRGPDDLLESTRSFGDAEAFLVDSFSDSFGGTGKRFDWSWIGAGRPDRLILSGGLDDASVGQAIERIAPAMVDVSSGIQGLDPRTKDPGRMARFVAAVLRADARRTPEPPTGPLA